MFRIRRVYDHVLPINKEALRQVKDILRTQFEGLSEPEVERVGEGLENPFKQRFRSVLFVAEGGRNRVLGFALVYHEPELQFCLLEYLAAARGRSGGGVGGAL